MCIVLLLLTWRILRSNNWRLQTISMLASSSIIYVLIIEISCQIWLMQSFLSSKLRLLCLFHRRWSSRICLRYYQSAAQIMTEYLLVQLLLIFLEFLYLGINAPLLSAFLRISELDRSTVTEAGCRSDFGPSGTFALFLGQV